MTIFLIIFYVSVLATSLILVITSILGNREISSANSSSSPLTSLNAEQGNKASHNQELGGQIENRLQEKEQLIKKAEALFQETRELLETTSYKVMELTNKVINLFTFNYFSEKLIKTPQALIISYLDKAILCSKDKNWKEAITSLQEALSIIDLIELTPKEKEKLKINLPQLINVFRGLESNLINPAEQQENSNSTVTTDHNSSSNRTLHATPDKPVRDEGRSTSQVTTGDTELRIELAKKDIEICKLRLEIRNLRSRVTSLEDDIEILNIQRQNERELHNLRFLYQMENVNTFQACQPYSPPKIWVSSGGPFFRPVSINSMQTQAEIKSNISVEEVNDGAIERKMLLLTGSESSPS